MAAKRSNLFWAIVTAAISLGVIFIAGYFLLMGNFSITNDPNAGISAPSDWNTIANNQYGFSFKYPADFGSKYASFQTSPIAVVTTNASQIDGSGCLVETNGQKESQVTINNMRFCLSIGSDPGAGQLYNSYIYTTLKNGNYVTLEYVVHTLNGCSPYMGTPDYAPCTDFMNNYNNIVVKTIEESVATLQFAQ